MKKDKWQSREEEEDRLFLIASSYTKYIKTYFYTNGSGDRDSQAHDFCIEQTDLELENVAHEHHLTESELDMIERGVSRLSEMMRKREEIECTITDNSVAITLEG